MSSATKPGSEDDETDAPGPVLSPPPAPQSMQAYWTTRLAQMKNSAAAAKKHWAPQLQQLQSRITSTTSAASIAAKTSRERLRATSMTEQLQPTIDRAKVGMNVLKRRVTHTSARVQRQMGKLGTRLANELFVDKKFRKIMQGDTLPTRFLQEASHDHIVYSMDVNPASLAETCFGIPFVLYSILSFAGCVPTIAQMAAVNVSIRQLVLAEPRLVRFCVRYGTFTPRLRLGFWLHVSGASSLQASSDFDYATYVCLAKSNHEWTDAIWVDVRRTYIRVAPHLRNGNPWHDAVDSDADIQEQMSNVLHALAGRFPEVGYCQGMDYITAHVLEHVKAADASYAHIHGETKHRVMVAQEETTFWLMASLFESYGLRDMFSPGLGKLHLHCYQFNRLFQLGLPTLYDHFHTETIMVEMYLVGWFQTLFLYLNALPKSSLDAIWDVFFFEKSWKVLFRVALAMLQASESHLLQQPIDHVMRFLNTFATHQHVLAATPLREAALRIKITNSMLTRLEKDHAAKQRRKPSPIY
ncbi:unnamed protein product [Aphanomyces euteiches]|nr:hypothetical protein AeRB84_019597 [Aphanomyces euteiches]